VTAILPQTVQFLVAALGGFAFHLLGIPAAWMSGAMVAVVILGAFGRSRPLPRPLADAAMLVSGATMGGGITPEALAAVTRYPASLALLVLAVAAGTGASMLWLTRAAGWRRDDALLASAPGALSTVLVIAVERKASVGSIVVVQSIRLFVLIALLPSLVVFLGGGAPGSRLPGEGMPLESPAGLAAILVGGLALGLVLERLRFAAPILLGATLVSATLHATGFAPGVVPPPVAVVGLVLIGVFIGERFRTLELTSLRRVLPAALGSLVLSTGVAMSLAAAASGLAGVGLSEALVAFAPGGLEAMMVLALILGLDPLYVGVHHLARFLGIAMVLPVVVGFLGRPQGETAGPADP
jgi:membrane AbrB-like protein